MKNALSRRQFIKAGALTLLGTAGAAAVSSLTQKANAGNMHQGDHHGHDPMPSMIGEVDRTRNGFNPSDILTDFDYGEVSTLESGQTLREYRIVAVN